MAELQTAPADAGTGRRLLTWVDNRFPLTKLFNEHMAQYYAPKNFNIWYVFGSLALLVLVNQILTGIILTMHYKPDAAKAFESVEYIMRDVPWGWLVRYMHSTGASAFFIVVYLHMFRGLLYGSYRKPRELVWIFGCGIFLCLMAEAFMGYLLPWGQMSYWGAQVIINLASANRDPAHCSNPEQLDLERTDSRHLAFGHGIHFCLGAPLGRMEAQIALASTLQRFPQLQLAVPFQQLHWSHGDGLVLRGLTQLPIIPGPDHRP